MRLPSVPYGANRVPRALVRSSATCSDTGQRVAIKKITNIFKDLNDTKRILREVKLLRHFSHNNVRASCSRSCSFLPSILIECGSSAAI